MTHLVGVDMLEVPLSASLISASVRMPRTIEVWIETRNSLIN